MQIALFGRPFNPDFFPQIKKMLDLLDNKIATFYIHRRLYEFIKEKHQFSKQVVVYESYEQISPDVFALISIGGDGTLLDTLPYVRNSGIPVVGINTGRLGFLSSQSTDDVEVFTHQLLNKNYQIESRSLLQLNTGAEKLFGNFPYALNEFTIIKRDTTTMIAISAYVNNQYLNTYWADGLLVATPTGSTGYSLSCGGPIISPEAENFIITAIASHNLTVRPIVIKDNSTIKLRLEGREKNHLVLMDSRSIPLQNPIDLIITKADFKINLISIEQNDFFKTIRNKLAWGLDKRN